MSKKLISIITPVYNEEETIRDYYRRMKETLDSLSDRYDFEIILTDNASTDKTFSIIRELAAKDPIIRAYRFSRNFGYQKSILTGWMKAKGDAAIEFDCDLQDPPSLLIDFLGAWEKGAQIVYGIRTKRQEGPVITKLREIFYRFINAISEYNLPPDAGDFMMLDRAVLDQIRLIDDDKPYLRGTIFSMGFEQHGIEYERDARLHGESKFPMKKMVALAWDGIVNQSELPLRLATYAGFTAAFLTLILSGYYLFLYFIGADVEPGFTTTVLLILFSISLNAIFLGIIGEYIARIYRQMRSKTVTIIAEAVGETDRLK